MSKVEKQVVGFKFGKHRLILLATLGEVQHNGRTYRLVRVQTHDSLEYLSLRLYNQRGKFIKQFLMEPELAKPIARLLESEAVPDVQGELRM